MFDTCRDSLEWIQVSNNVQPGANFRVLHLDASTWYNLRITAHNSAGFTVGEYEFATLTATGGIFRIDKIISFALRMNQKTNIARNLIIN